MNSSKTAPSDATINNTNNSSPLPNVTPLHLLFASSIPLCLGAYAGYKIELTKGSSSSSMEVPGSSILSSSKNAKGGLLRKVLTTPAEVHYPTTGGTSTTTPKIPHGTTLTQQHPPSSTPHAGRIAVKALGIGSLLSIGGVTLLTASMVKLSGCNSLMEFIQLCQEWTPRKRQEWEDKWGIKPKSRELDDVKHTRNMTEEEEWEYLKQKYIPEWSEREGDSGKGE